MTHTSSSSEESGNAHSKQSGSSESDEDEGYGEASSFRGGTYVQRGRRTSSARGTQKRRRSEGQQSIRCGLVDALKAESRLKEHASSQASLDCSLSNLSLCLIAPQCSSGGHSDAYKNYRNYTDAALRETVFSLPCC